MIRKDREITDLGEQLAILRDCDACRIALNDPETGFPYVIPLNFGLDVEGEQVYLYFHSACRGRKLDLIAQDNRATFEVDCDHRFIFYDERMSCTMGYRSVIGHGTIEMVPDDQKVAGLKILMRHYHEDDFTFNLKTVPATTVWRLKVLDMVGKFRNNEHPGEHRLPLPTTGPVAMRRGT